MIEINPVSVAGDSGGGNMLRRRRAFEAYSFWNKKAVIPPYPPSSEELASNNIQVNTEMASLTNLRDSTGLPSSLGMDSIIGYWPFPGSDDGRRYETEYVPNGVAYRQFARVAFSYEITESDEYHKPWNGITVGMICKANLVVRTKVTTYVPGEPPVVVETEVSTPNDIHFSRSFVKSDWVYDPMAPSQSYGRTGSAFYNYTTNTWDLVNPDLVGDEFKAEERIDTSDYDPSTEVVVTTEIRSKVVIYGVNAYDSFKPFVMEYCTNPGFWFG
jgi:hypothetical protein